MTAFRRLKEREERWETERRDQERSRLIIERRNARCVIPSDVFYHLSEQRVLEAFGIDFAGNVVIPDFPPLPRRRPTSCCFLFEKNLFAIEFLIPVLMSYQIQFFTIPSPHRPTGRQ